ncbi:hypothetical protein KARL1_168 [Acinetobacter phage KARL-1]|uniref:Uncharacterized protein n=1 Tax=Acinetobacter phage KARL-1 TaxID=2301662 RepID=A0A385IIS3_9CAUD|nr:hypothetical protein HYP70_gp168 [Acinetobacter phage KARL-1]AXY82787.1 hypothetical protein KARL1_168 [Acinetobacter phage KARL-1]
MPIRVKPSIDNTVIINKKYFDDNVFIAQYFPELKPGIPYTVESVTILIDDIWGIDKLKNTETGEIIDISTVEDLKDYWCILDADDSYRVIG